MSKEELGETFLKIQMYELLCRVCGNSKVAKRLMIDSLSLIRPDVKSG